MISTAELVKHMRSLGLRASAESLRQDVQRGLVSPGMPGYARPGKGVRARWTPMSVRRAIYLARLRLRKTNGHVLPLLAYLRDGWGWPLISADVALAAERAVASDRRALKAKHIRDEWDLEDAAAQGVGPADPSFIGAELAFRRYLLSMEWRGVPASDTTAIPFADLLARRIAAALGEEVDQAEIAQASARAAQIEEVRRSWGMGPREIPEWLRSMRRETAERGRLRLREEVRIVRRLGRKFGVGNPTTLSGMSPGDLWEFLRRNPGRPTPAQVLGAWLAQEIYTAELERRADALS
jgi:hypothetical protein